MVPIATIETRLSDALRAFVGIQGHLGKGAFLLEIDANERSMSHHLANYLVPHFVGWDIDCEYNRDGIDDPKMMILPPRKTQPSALDVHARTVYPDIIVHHRGVGGADNNLLVIEVKKSSNGDGDEFEYDRIKLREFQSQLYYQHAYLVTLVVGEIAGNPWTIERVPQLDGNLPQ